MAANRREKEKLVVVILGSTGTGKSRLSIEIGKIIGGEIISADSMQVYKGLDIITNKVTAEEQAAIPHHLLDFVEANEKFSVVEFKNIALDAISDIFAREKVPIIVGGTNYYIESLLWENLIDEKKRNLPAEGGNISSKSRKVETEERKEDDCSRNANTQSTFPGDDGDGEIRSISRKIENEECNEDDRTRNIDTHSKCLAKESIQRDNEVGDIHSNPQKVENEELNESNTLPVLESSANQGQEINETLQEETSECGKITDESTEQRNMNSNIEDVMADGELKEMGNERVSASNESGREDLEYHKQEQKYLRQEFTTCESLEQAMDEHVEKRQEIEKQNEAEVCSSVSTCVDKETMQTEISLHEQLANVDSAMAQKLHPNDTRKIKRSLQVFQQSGITHSEHIALQQSYKGSSNYSGPMRFENVCVLWLHCDYETLDKRLDARVDQMIEQGLVKELVEYYTSCESKSAHSKMQSNEGIFQSIGFKEFQEFLNAGYSNKQENAEMFDGCVEAMKCATRRYARKQVRWVNNRFLGRPPTSSPDVYDLDATDLERWESNVLEKALDIVKSFKTGEKVTHIPLQRRCSATVDKHSNHTCTVCNGRIIIGDQNWAAHLRSRSHQHYKKKQRKLEEKCCA